MNLDENGTMKATTSKKSEPVINREFQELIFSHFLFHSVNRQELFDACTNELLFFKIPKFVCFLEHLLMSYSYERDFSKVEKKTEHVVLGWKLWCKKIVINRMIKVQRETCVYFSFLQCHFRRKLFDSKQLQKRCKKFLLD